MTLTTFEYPLEEWQALASCSGIPVTAKNMFFLLKVFPWKWLSYFIRYIDPNYYTFVNQTVTDVLSGLTKNKQLIAVLCGQYGDYGMVPSKASFFFHAAVVNHYLGGGWFPRGGTSVIAKNICKTKS